VSLCYQTEFGNNFNRVEPRWGSFGFDYLIPRVPEKRAPWALLFNAFGVFDESVDLHYFTLAKVWKFSICCLIRISNT